MIGARLRPAGVIAWTVYLAGLFYTVVLTELVGAPLKGSGPAVIILSAVAVCGALRVSAISRLDRRSRLAWRLTGISLCQFVISNVLLTILPRAEMFPSPGDYLRLLSTLTLMAALHVFPLRTGDHSERLKLGIDAAIVLAGGTVLIWYFVIGPQLGHSDSVGTVIAGGVYPICDLILVFAAVRLVLRGADPAGRRSAQLITAALLLLAVTDTYESYRAAVTPDAARGNPVEIAAVLTLFLLLSLAAFEQTQHDGQATALIEHRDGGFSWLPYAAVALTCALMVVEALRDQGLSRLGGLVIGAAVTFALVVWRQILTLQENHALATTDRLTGVANRARIDETLSRTLQLAGRNDRHTGLILADLNGFKEINDTLGHAAGDEMLAHFAQVLRRNVLGADLVGRLGGDEFVIILTGDINHARAQAVADRITAALTEPVVIADTVVQPSASLGVAVGGPGQFTAGELLQHADTAMYEHKRESKKAVTQDLRA